MTVSVFVAHSGSLYALSLVSHSLPLAFSQLSQQTDVLLFEIELYLELYSTVGVFSRELSSVISIYVSFLAVYCCQQSSTLIPAQMMRCLLLIETPTLPHTVHNE